MGADDPALLQPQASRVRSLWWTRDHRVRDLAQVRERPISKKYRRRWRDWHRPSLPHRHARDARLERRWSIRWLPITVGTTEPVRLLVPLSQPVWARPRLWFLL